MANKVTIGSLIVLTNRDSIKAPFAPGNEPAPRKDPIEDNIPAPEISRIDFSQHVAAPQPSLAVEPARVAAPQPSQEITRPTFGDTLQRVPKVTPTSEAERQPSQAVTLSRPPADPVKIPEPTLSKVAVQQPAPEISRTSVAEFQPAGPVVLSAPPAEAAKVPATPLSKEPAGVTFLPNTNLSHPPAEPVKIADPPLTHVAADQPAPEMSLTTPALPQTSQDVSLSKAPAKPIDIPEPQKTVPAEQQPSQDVSLSSKPANPIKLDEMPKTIPAAQQPAPDVSLSAPPAKPLKIDDPPKVVESPAQKSPDLGKPKELAFQPSPPPTLPASLNPQPAPAPSAPAKLPPPPDFKPAENAVLPPEPAPPPSVPAALPPPPDFKPVANAVLPAEPAPPPSVPAVLPAMPAPGPSSPAVLPAMPAPGPSSPAVLPAMAAPPPSSPKALPVMPAPPPSSPAALPNMPAPAISPTHEAGLQSPKTTDAIGKSPYAPGGQLDAPKDVLGSLQLVDQKVKDFLHTLSPYSAIGSSTPGGQGWNPELYAKQLVRMGTQIGATGLALFGATQLGLFALNRDGQIWNPLTMAPPPFTEGFVPASIDALFLSHEEKVVNNNKDRLKDLGDGRYNDVQVVSYPPFVAATILGGAIGSGLNPGPKLVGASSQDRSLVDDPNSKNPLTLGMSIRDAALQTRNLYTPDATYEQKAGDVFSIGQLVDDFIDGSNKSKLIVTDPVTDASRVDITKLYVLRPQTFEYRPSKNAAPPFVAAPPTALNDPLVKSFYPSGVVPASLDPDGETNGFFALKKDDDPTKKISDDDAYVPLSFMDTRPDAGNNTIKCVYFRPFITSLTEEFAPEWNKQSYFGRVDPVCSYMSTNRTINLGFIVYAFTPEDLSIIYQKLNWLTSMVYPEYDKDLLFKSGPTVRLRVGDLIKTHGGFGLPGIIESLSIDYNEVVWELKKGNKAPMGYRVSLSFQVLHETPIGKGINGRFGGIGTIKDGKYSPPTSAKDSKAKAPELAANAAGFFRGMGSEMNDEIPEK